MSKDKKQILSVRVRREVDTDPDIGHVGEYTNELKPGNILTSTGEYVEDTDAADYPPKGNIYRAFKPCAGGEKVGTADYKKYGKQDFEYMQRFNNGDICFYGVWAEAKVQVDGSLPQTVRSGGVWGVESDDDVNMRDVAEEELAQLQDEVRALGFGQLPAWGGEFSE